MTIKRDLRMRLNNSSRSLPDESPRVTIDEAIARVVREEIAKLDIRRKRGLTIEEAAAYLGVSAGTIYNLISTKVLTPVVIPGVKKKLLDLEDLQAIFRDGKLP